MTRLTERQFKRFVKAGQKAQAMANTMCEKEWLQQVKDLARTLGWTVYHTLRSDGSDPGFPDLVMAKKFLVSSSKFLVKTRDQKPETGNYFVRLVVAELKREGEKPTAGQQQWLDFFAAVGAETYVWRPSDLEEVKRVLR